MTQSGGLKTHFYSVTHYNSQGSAGEGGGSEKKISLQTQFVHKMVNSAIYDVGSDLSPLKSIK